MSTPTIDANDVSLALAGLAVAIAKAFPDVHHGVAFRQNLRETLIKRANDFEKEPGTVPAAWLLKATIRALGDRQVFPAHG